MTKPTLADLIDVYIFAIVRELKPWIYPLQAIIEEVVILEEAYDLILVGKSGNRIRFSKQAIDVVRKTFKNAEWFLSKPSRKKNLKGLSLLIGVLPNEHYLILAPKKKKVVI